MRCSDERFDEKSIDSLRCNVSNVQPGEIDLLVPSRKEPVIDLESGAKLLRNRQAGSSGATRQAL
jgi:hypothetical protein